MKVGFIVDGQAEFRSLKFLLERIPSNHTLITPLYADIQPTASTTKIVRATLPAMRVMASRGADRVILLLDLERRSECVPEWHSELEDCLARPCQDAGIKDVRVVIKVKTFENWLISDPEGLSSMPKRFSLSERQVSSIVPNKADHVNGLQILKQATIGKDYDKIQDAMRIMSILDPNRAAVNSRSIRRLFRLLDHPIYSGQSKLPPT